MVPAGFGVVRRRFGRLAVLASAPALVLAIYFVSLIAAAPNSEQMQRRIDDATRVAGGPPGPIAALLVVFGPLIPVVVVFTLLLLVAGALFAGAASFLVVREANGQPTMFGQALRFGLSRLVPLIGWSLAAEVALIVVLGVPVAGAIYVDADWVALVCVAVGVALTVPIMVVYVAALIGAVVVERAGPKRAIALVKGYFWASCGRVVVAGLIYRGYGIVMNLVSELVTPAVESVTAGVVLAAVVEGVMIIPPLVFGLAVCVVSYAEPRFRADPSVRTRTLAAQLSAATSR